MEKVNEYQNFSLKEKRAVLQEFCIKVHEILFFPCGTFEAFIL